MSATEAGHTVRQHFEGRAPEVKAIYTKLVGAAKRFGAVREDPKKTSIHLVRKTAFAGVATRKSALILTIKSDADIASERIAKRERVSANRWHLEVKLAAPAEVDREVIGWLKKAYALSA